MGQDDTVRNLEFRIDDGDLRMPRRGVSDSNDVRLALHRRPNIALPDESTALDLAGGRGRELIQADQLLSDGLSGGAHRSRASSPSSSRRSRAPRLREQTQAVLSPARCGSHHQSASQPAELDRRPGSLRVGRRPCADRAPRRLRGDLCGAASARHGRPLAGQHCSPTCRRNSHGARQGFATSHASPLLSITRGIRSAISASAASRSSWSS